MLERERGGGANAYQFRITSESLIYLVHSYMYMVPVVKRTRDDYTIWHNNELQERETER